MATDSSAEDHSESAQWQIRLQQTCSVLERVSRQFADDSVEAVAVREAAQALILVQQQRALQRAYRRLLRAAGGELDAEMRQRLVQMGIDPDELDQDGPAERDCD